MRIIRIHKNRSTKETIFTLQLVTEAIVKEKEDTFMAFEESEEAFDTTNQKKIFKILENQS